MVVGREQSTPASARRSASRAQVDGDVEHPAAQATDQLPLGRGRALEMQAADGAAPAVMEWLTWTKRRSGAAAAKVLGAEQPRRGCRARRRAARSRRPTGRRSAWLQFHAAGDRRAQAGRRARIGDVALEVGAAVDLAALVLSPVPGRGALERRRGVPHRPPAEALPGLAAIRDAAGRPRAAAASVERRNAAPASRAKATMTSATLSWPDAVGAEVPGLGVGAWSASRRSPSIR